MELIRDKHGRLTGVIREISGGRRRLSTPTGEAIADYDPITRATYDTDRRRLGTGDRLAGLVDDQD
jgi:hypothetical protein